jgi:putative endonuclease
MTNRSNKVLYVGYTNNLQRRVKEHKNKLIEGFTSKYNVSKLVYYENVNVLSEAQAKEKQIKGWLRQKKIKLIESINPNWEDLAEKNKLSKSLDLLFNYKRDPSSH